MCSVWKRRYQLPLKMKWTSQWRKMTWVENDWAAGLAHGVAESGLFRKRKCLEMRIFVSVSPGWTPNWNKSQGLGRCSVFICQRFDSRTEILELHGKKRSCGFCQENQQSVLVSKKISRVKSVTPPHEPSSNATGQFGGFKRCLKLPHSPQGDSKPTRRVREWRPASWGEKKG